MVRKVLMTVGVAAALAGGGAAIASAATSSSSTSPNTTTSPAHRAPSTGHGAAPRPGAKPGSSHNCPDM